MQGMRRSAVTSVRLAAAVVVGAVAVGILVLPSAAAATTAPPTWTTTSVPQVAGSSPALNGIDCTGVGSCVAVGTSGGHAVVDTLSGGAWTGTTGIDPADATSVSLAAVSCPSAASCVAVGSATNGGDEPLIEALAAGTWTAVVPAEPSGITNVQLTGVSCPTSTSCVAVGWGQGTGGSQAVAYVLCGRRWMPAALPAESTSQLLGVSCPSAGSCEAVGTSMNTGGALTQQTVSLLVDSLAAGTWTATTLNTQNTSYDVIYTQELDAVSCAGVGSCVAVGRGGQAAGDCVDCNADASEWTLAKGSWTQNTTFYGEADHYEFDDLPPPAVSCPSTVMCMAVAGLTDPGPAISAIAEELAGSTWKLDTGPIPIGAQGALTTVSCATPTWCAAVGANTWVGAPNFEARVWIYGTQPATEAPVGAVGGLLLAVVLGLGAYLRFRRRGARPTA